MMAEIAKARRVVVKVGSALLVDSTTGTLKRAWLQSLVADLAALKAADKDILLVSSGAVALGRGALGLRMPGPSGPRTPRLVPSSTSPGARSSCVPV